MCVIWPICVPQRVIRTAEVFEWMVSPDSDNRPSDDYDPPWEFKSNVLRPSVNGSISVPERLSQPACNQSQLSSSVTHDKLESDDQSDKNLPVTVPKALPAKPAGSPAHQTQSPKSLNKLNAVQEKGSTFSWRNFSYSVHHIHKLP
ncbi:uncharacterized protein TNCT_419751 [Trichonephila clavata]|uniref:Uncharacterized protein n=1 Tax=Trichonephila clavata TaxID=2740835 RepID=A0A8X6INK4_TRICU|nr:uncharacterized protein TNCT_419751 [Trichonephila clavata]